MFLPKLKLNPAAMKKGDTSITQHLSHIPVDPIKLITNTKEAFVGTKRLTPKVLPKHEKVKDVEPREAIVYYKG